MHINEPLKKYIDELASRKPTPGGGSAAALTGATGTALLEMVCNFTIGNDKYKDAEEYVKGCTHSLKNIHDGLLAIIDDDVKAYSEIRTAFKTKDKAGIDKALKNGYYVCLRICELSRDALKVTEELPEKGNPNLITDIGCGAELLNAAFNAGVFNCEINLNGIGDKDFAKKEKSLLGNLKKESEALYKGSVRKTKERMR
jgi:formiminotetrahydrofolate cyclodeaminase